MAKGIIVVDVPESCIKCEYCNSDGYCKVAHKDVFAFGPREKKSDWCPICQLKCKSLNNPICQSIFCNPDFHFYLFLPKTDIY